MCMTSLSESGHGGRFEPCEECKRVRDYSTSLHDFIQWLSQRHEHDGLTKGQIIHMAAKLDVGGRWQDDHVKFDGRTAIEVLEAENAALRQERDRLAGVVERADALADAVESRCSKCCPRSVCEMCASGLNDIRLAAKAYQEARHG